MKDKPFYELMKRIKDDSRLAVFFNGVMQKLDLIRITSAPKTFTDVHSCEGDNMRLFYETCLWEMWMHEVIIKLCGWIDTLDEYFGEFDGSWKYYACSKRLEAIKEYGGEQSDYNTDGSIKTENLSDTELESSTVVRNLVSDDWRDIVLDTTTDDLGPLISCLYGQAEFSLGDAFRKCFGKEPTTYKQDENGNMVPMTFVDKELRKASERYDAELFASNVYMIGFCLQRMINMIKRLNPFADNKNELEIFRRDAQCMLNLRICELSFAEELDKEMQTQQ